MNWKRKWVGPADDGHEARSVERTEGGNGERGPVSETSKEQG